MPQPIPPAAEAAFTALTAGRDNIAIICFIPDDTEEHRHTDLRYQGDRYVIKTTSGTQHDQALTGMMDALNGHGPAGTLTLHMVNDATQAHTGARWWVAHDVLHPHTTANRHLHGLADYIDAWPVPYGLPDDGCLDPVTEGHTRIERDNAAPHAALFAAFLAPLADKHVQLAVVTAKDISQSTPVPFVRVCRHDGTWYCSGPTDRLTLVNQAVNPGALATVVVHLVWHEDSHEHHGACWIVDEGKIETVPAWNADVRHEWTVKPWTT